MNHPHDLLAELVDGTLGGDRLAEVQAHLDACEACRADLADATAGRDAARSLPQEVPPSDLHDRVVAVAGGGRRAPAWYRWAGAAAAAAVVLAIAVALPDVGRDEDPGAGAEDSTAAGTFEAPEQAGAEATRGFSFAREDRNYDAQDLEALAENADPRSSGGAEAMAADTGSAAAAESCVRRAFEDRPVGRLARLIDARFRGRDAYIALFFEGPGAGQPADTASVWVASKEGCRVLSSAFARLDP